MNDTPWEDPSSELDRLLRSAGGFVQPSEDLRPRVLEAARAQHFERKTRLRVVQAAVLVLVLGAGLAAGIRRIDTSPAFEAAQPQTNLPSGELGAGQKHPADPNWETVERYRKLRVRQARMFNLPL